MLASNNEHKGAMLAAPQYLPLLRETTTQARHACRTRRRFAQLFQAFIIILIRFIGLPRSLSMMRGLAARVLRPTTRKFKFCRSGKDSGFTRVLRATAFAPAPLPAALSLRSTKPPH